MGAHSRCLRHALQDPVDGVCRVGYVLSQVLLAQLLLLGRLLLCNFDPQLCKVTPISVSYHLHVMCMPEIAW